MSTSEKELREAVQSMCDAAAAIIDGDEICTAERLAILIRPVQEALASGPEPQEQDDVISKLMEVGRKLDEQPIPTKNRMTWPDGWFNAIDNELVCRHLGVADATDSYEEARRKLHELIQWHVAVATDPAVNGGYKLVKMRPKVAPCSAHAFEDFSVG